MDVSVDLSQELKDLTGQFQFPDDVAPAARKISGKFTVGRVNYALFNQIMFAQTQTVGTKQITPNPGEAHNISGTTLNVTNNGANFVQDLGIVYQANFQAFIDSGAIAPGNGQYQVAANGQYTLAAGDNNAPVYVSYVFNNATAGYTVPLAQTLMGYGPVFSLWLSEPYQTIGGLGQGLHLFACRLSKLGHALKNTDYLKPELEFMAYANAAGQVAEFFQVVP